MYERKGVIPIEDILPLIRDRGYGLKPKVTILGETVNVFSLRLRTFKKSLECVSCGLRGTFFALERAGSSWHLNLYARTQGEGSEEVLMTHDHIVPLSKGGLNHITNTQTMCVRCNGRKGNG